MSRLIFYLSFLLFSIASAATLPRPSATSAFNSSKPSLSSDLQCMDHSIFRDKRPKLSDCNRAIHKLPASHDQARFHLHGVGDGFRLPKSRIFGGCEVTVDLQGGAISDEYSWLGIGVAATRLSVACQAEGKLNILRTGGWATTGDLDFIRITLAKPIQSIGVGNLTVVGGLLQVNGTTVN